MAYNVKFSKGESYFFLKMEAVVISFVFQSMGIQHAS